MTFTLDVYFKRKVFKLEQVYTERTDGVKVVAQSVSYMRLTPGPRRISVLELLYAPITTS